MPAPRLAHLGVDECGSLSDATDWFVVAGVLTINHVDSQRNPLVQLADFVAGSIYTRHKAGDTTGELLRSRLRAEAVADWPGVKRQWMSRG